MKSRIIAVLVRLYPRAWSDQYGAELADVLSARPLTARVLADVVGSALLQRVRATDVATRAGLAMLLVTFVAFAWNVAAPPPYAAQTNARIPVLDERVAIVQQPLDSELYVLMLVAFSTWVTLRRGGSLVESGKAAMKASFIAGLPMMLVGILILSGVLSISSLAQGDIPATYREHGFTLTYYTTRNDLPAPFVLLFSPLSRLPGSFIWGVVGGLIGRGLARSQRPPATNARA
jgi:hypothetical protein